MNRALALVVLAALGLTSGCGSSVSAKDATEVDSSDAATESSDAAAESSDAATVDPRDAEMAPKDASLGLEPSAPAGTATEVVPGLNITLPEGSVLHDTGAPEGPGETVTYRMPDHVDGLPAVQITTAEGIEIYSETWAREAFQSLDATYDHVHRSVETWPGADRAVAFNWREDVPLTTGEVHKTEVASLWLATANGQVFVIMAVAPEGELEGSAVLDSMLSAQLVGS